MSARAADAHPARCSHHRPDRRSAGHPHHATSRQRPPGTPPPAGAPTHRGRAATTTPASRCSTTTPRAPAPSPNSWAATGGGDGAAHCRALAQIELGNVATGAELLERLADTTKAPDLARASVYGQAVQAWLMAGKYDRAFDAATLALALSPNDVGLLIDRAEAEGGMERYHEAIDDLDHALAIDPHRAEAFVLRASAWRQLDNLEVATSDIERRAGDQPRRRRGAARTRHPAPARRQPRRRPRRLAARDQPGSRQHDGGSGAAGPGAAGCR